jgi:hypothetical protein
MIIAIDVPVHDRKSHRMTKDVKIRVPDGVDVGKYRDYILNSIADWFEEYENQPTASQLHPL